MFTINSVFPVLRPSYLKVTYDPNIYNINTTGDSSEVGTANPSGSRKHWKGHK